VSKVSVLLRQLDKQMTKGPWRHEPEHCDNGYEPDRIFSDNDAANPKVILDMAARPNSAKDASGICEARNLLLSAAEEIEQLEQQQGRMPEVCEKLVAAEQKVEQLEKELHLYQREQKEIGELVGWRQIDARPLLVSVQSRLREMDSKFKTIADLVDFDAREVESGDGGIFASIQAIVRPLPLPPSDSKAS
jgi:hypothetical protein